MFKRLFTEKDNLSIFNIKIYNFHKIFGFSSLSLFFINFIASLYNLQLFKNYKYLYFTIFIHIMTSYSSLIFKVLSHKNVNNTYQIWEELRFHNMTFSTRQMILLYIHHLYSVNYMQFIDYKLYKFIIVILTSLVADFITMIHGTSGISTVRGDNYKKDTFILKLGKYFFSYGQLYLIYLMLTRDDNIMNTIYFGLIPIQLSAFIMTLKFKNIISNNVGHLLYSLTILFDLFISTFVESNDKIYSELFIVFCICFYRFYFNISKYLIWFIVFIFNFYML